LFQKQKSFKKFKERGNHEQVFIQENRLGCNKSPGLSLANAGDASSGGIVLPTL
jgi:hypothetical protein